ncbi:hypothetical protein RYX36_021309 [Vicia faba]
MSSGRKSRGHQKIEIKKMSNWSNLQVIFSRRRSGLFKKVVKKVFSFGHSNIDTVIDSYLSQIPPQNNNIMQFIEARHKANVCEINDQLTQINKTLNVEKKHGDELGHLQKEYETQFLWTCSHDRMNWVQLKIFKKALEECKNLVAQHTDRLVIQDILVLVIQDILVQTLLFCVDSVSPFNIHFQHQLIPQQLYVSVENDKKKLHNQVE